MMQFVYMNISVHIEDPIIELLDDDNFSSLAGGYVNAPSFRIKGRYLGITTIYVSPFHTSIILNFVSVKFLCKISRAQRLTDYGSTIG